MSSNLVLDFSEFNLRMVNQSENRVYEFEDFRLDAGHLMLYRGNEELELAPKAVETLLALVERRGEIVSKDELLQAVWSDTIVEESNLFLYLSVLRKTLGTQPSGKPWIQTLRRRGYRFNGEVRNGDGATTTWEDAKPVPTVRMHALFWSAIVFALMAAGTVALFIYRSTGAAGPQTRDLSITALTNGVDVQGAAISRDGKTLVYQTFDGQRSHMFLQQVGKLDSIEILATKPVIGTKTFSPDGVYLYYLAKDTSESHMSLFKMPVSGGASSKLLTGVFLNSAISFSPDGSKLVFSRYDEKTKVASIVITSVDGTGARAVLSSTSEYLTYPAWSPDGRTIAFARSRPSDKPRDQYYSIETVSVNGGPARTLLNEKFSNSFRIAWTSGGDGIVFGGTKFGEHMTGRRDQVWFASLKTGKITRISPEGTRYVFEGLTDENAAIMFPLSRPSQIWEMDANGDSRTARQLTTGNSEGRTGMAPLPDGRLGYMLRNGDNWEIWVMNGDGSNQKQIFNANPIAEELRATTDGKYFLFNSEVDGNYQLFRLNTDGTDLKQLTFGDDVYSGDSSPSSDSRSVVFTRVAYLEGRQKTASLYSVPIDGGEPGPVAGEITEAFTPHHSPDGQFISYVDTSAWPQSRIAVLAIDDASTRFFNVHSAGLNVGSVWTPDSKGVAYIVASEKVSNVWIQPIDGGPPRQFTDFTSGRIHRIAFSADGKRLYLARGYAVNDALLVKGFMD